MAVAAGHSDGVNTRDLYVADAHNRRIVHLRDAGDHLEWVGEVRHEAQLLTSLATDQWGNVYAASPQAASVTKFSPDLVKVAELSGDLAHPRSFHVPFVNIHDHRDGKLTRAGQPNGISVDQWGDGTGVGLWKLGVELSQLAVQGGDAPAAHFLLTDQAKLSLEVRDAGNGRTLSSRDARHHGGGTPHGPAHGGRFRRCPGGSRSIGARLGGLELRRRAHLTWRRRTSSPRAEAAPRAAGAPDPARQHAQSHDHDYAHRDGAAGFRHAAGDVRRLRRLGAPAQELERRVHARPERDRLGRHR